MEYNINDILKVKDDKYFPDNIDIGDYVVVYNIDKDFVYVTTVKDEFGVNKNHIDNILEKLSEEEQFEFDKKELNLYINSMDTVFIFEKDNKVIIQLHFKDNFVEYAFSNYTQAYNAFMSYFTGLLVDN